MRRDEESEMPGRAVQQMWAAVWPGSGHLERRPVRTTASTTCQCVCVAGGGEGVCNLGAGPFSCPGVTCRPRPVYDTPVQREGGRGNGNEWIKGNRGRRTWVYVRASLRVSEEAVDTGLYTGGTSEYCHRPNLSQIIHPVVPQLPAHRTTSASITSYPRPPWAYMCIL